VDITRENRLLTEGPDFLSFGSDFKEISPGALEHEIASESGKSFILRAISAKDLYVSYVASK
jgi:hypothetical protein